MNLSPKSQALFQSFFIQRTKEHQSNYKFQLQNKLGGNKFNQLLNKPSSTIIHQIGRGEFQQSRFDTSRKISLDESQLTVIGIRRLSNTSRNNQQNNKVSKLSQSQQRKVKQIHVSDKESINHIQMSSVEQDKDIRQQQQSIKMQKSIIDSKYQSMKINFFKKKHLQYNGIDEYFRDILFHQQKITPEQCDQIRIINRRQEHTLEPLESGRNENLRYNY